jgi:hypothetical protein
VTASSLHSSLRLFDRFISPICKMVLKSMIKTMLYSIPLKNPPKKPWNRLDLNQSWPKLLWLINQITVCFRRCYLSFTQTIKGKLSLRRQFYCIHLQEMIIVRSNSCLSLEKYNIESLLGWSNPTTGINLWWRVGIWIYLKTQHIRLYMRTQKTLDSHRNIRIISNK